MILHQCLGPFRAPQLLHTSQRAEHCGRDSLRLHWERETAAKGRMLLGPKEFESLAGESAPECTVRSIPCLQEQLWPLPLGGLHDQHSIESVEKWTLATVSFGSSSVREWVGHCKRDGGDRFVEMDTSRRSGQRDCWTLSTSACDLLYSWQTWTDHPFAEAIEFQPQVFVLGQDLGFRGRMLRRVSWI